MDKLTLADIQALAASADYGGRGFLQQSSAALGLSAALFLSNLDLWQGAGYSLTDDEIDDIQAMVAQLENDLINTGDMYIMDNCRVSMVAAQEIAHNVATWLAFDLEYYDDNGMHDNVVNNHRITPQETGLHLITATINWEQNSIGRRELWLYRYRSPSFATIGYAAMFPVVSNVTPSQVVVSQDIVELGDYYALRVKQTSGSDLDILKALELPLFAVAQI